MFDSKVEKEPGVYSKDGILTEALSILNYGESTNNSIVLYGDESGNIKFEGNQICFWGLEKAQDEKNISLRSILDLIVESEMSDQKNVIKKYKEELERLLPEHKIEITRRKDDLEILNVRISEVEVEQREYIFKVVDSVFVKDGSESIYCPFVEIVYKPELKQLWSNLSTQIISKDNEE